MDSISKNAQPPLVLKKLDEHQEKLFKPIFDQLPYFVKYPVDADSSSVNVVFGREALGEIWKTITKKVEASAIIELTDLNVFHNFRWLVAAEIVPEVEALSASIWARHESKNQKRSLSEIEIIEDEASAKKKPRQSAREKFFKTASGSKGSSA